MTELTAVDIFSGIGGFSLAAQACGVKTLCFVEKDERCQAFLSRAWPGVPIHDDIKTFPGEKYRGATILMGGPPCQAASRAGKQRGAGDDRWLWPAALEVLASVRPAWAIFENPPGIGDLFKFGVQIPVDGDGVAIGEIGEMVNRSGQNLFSKTLAEIESQGYELQIYGIPACAVGAPHRRERYWIVCHRLGDAASFTCAGARDGEAEERWEPAIGGTSRDGNLADASSGAVQQEEASRAGGACGIAAARTGQGHLADAKRERRERRTATPGQAEGGESLGAVAGLRSDPWADSVWVSCADGKFRRTPACDICLADGVSSELSAPLGEAACKNKIEAHRSLLAALGNAIVPQVAERIIRTIVMVEGQRVLPRVESGVIS